MRTSEWIQAGFATILAVAAWFRPLPAGRRRWVATLLAAFVVGAIAVVRFSADFLTPLQVSTLRDWLPVPLMLVPYWQTGQFFMGPNEKIQKRLAEIDHGLLALIPPIARTLGRYTRLSMEWAYMLCYPLVPLGFAALYLAGLRRYTNAYWFMVLVPAYLCYAITPFVPALPPRSTNGIEGIGGAPNKGRVMNLWILKYGSIQAISFPSAHVAAAFGVSLVLLRFVPVAGLVFLAVSIWIAVAAVVGGYHYAIDVLLGGALALIIAAAWLCHLIPSSLIAAPAIALAATF